MRINEFSLIIDFTRIEGLNPIKIFYANNYIFIWQN